MESVSVIVGIIGVACLIYLIYTIEGIPKKLDKKMRSLLVDYKKWAECDNRHGHRLQGIAKRQNELINIDSEDLDYLRTEKARIKVELDQLEDLNVFLKTPESDAEQRKYAQLAEVDNKIDEHPDREQELEETRSRLVARMEDIRKDEADRDPEQ